MSRTRKSPTQPDDANVIRQRVALVGQTDADHRAVTTAILSAVYAVMPPGSNPADLDIRTRSLPAAGSTAQCEVTVQTRPTHTPKVSNGLAHPRRRGH